MDLKVVDKVFLKPLDELIPYARNARTHSEEQVAQLAGLIRQYGFRNPILVDGESGIIAGHARVMAARKLGLDRVPCVDGSDLSETDRRAYMLADNRVALNSGWDPDILGLEMADLSDLGVDLTTLGFADDELERYMHGEQQPEDPIGRAGGLTEDWGAPPFSVFDARQGWWQERKRAWLALGIQSELGRGQESGAKAAPGGSPQPLDRAKAQRLAPGGGGGGVLGHGGAER